MTTATAANAVLRTAAEMFAHSPTVTVTVAKSSVTFTGALTDVDTASVVVTAVTVGIGSLSVSSKELIEAFVPNSSQAATISLAEGAVLVTGTNEFRLMAGQLGPTALAHPRSGSTIDTRTLMWVASACAVNHDADVLDALHFDQGTVEATDGFRLHSATVTGIKPGVVSAVLVRAAAVFAPAAVKVDVDGPFATVHSKTGDVTVIASGPLITEQYPSSGPLQRPQTASFDTPRAELFDELAQAAHSIGAELGLLAAGGSLTVAIGVEDGAVKMSLVDGDTSRSVGVTAPGVGQGSVIVDAAAFVSALSGTASEVSIALSSPINPIKITGTGRDGVETAFLAARNPPPAR